MVPENVCSATLPTFKGMTTEFSFMLLRLTRGRRQRTPGLYHVSFPGADFAYLVIMALPLSPAAHNSTVECADTGPIVAFTTTHHSFTSQSFCTSTLVLLPVPETHLQQNWYQCVTA